MDQNQPQVARNFKYSTDVGLLPDVPAAIEDRHNQLALEEHPIDANADDHNELIEWQNDDHQQEHQAIVGIESAEQNDEANEIIGYLKNAPNGHYDTDQAVAQENKEREERRNLKS